MDWRRAARKRMSHDRACVGMSDVRRNQEDISGGGEKGTNHVHTWAIYAMALDSSVWVAALG
jgi:hypothetical protein